MYAKKVMRSIIIMLIIAVMQNFVLVQMIQALPSDDNFEENDTFESAYLISAGQYPNLVGQDDDWYKVNVSKGDFLSVHIIFDHVDGDLDLYLYNVNRTLLNTSNSQANNEILSWRSLSSQILYFVVKNYSTNMDYDLRIEIGLVDDDYEENDQISQAVSIPAKFTSLLILNDSDWFHWNGIKATSIIINLKHMSIAEINIKLYNSSGNKILEKISSNFEIGVEILVNSSQSFFIEISSSQNPIPYYLSLDSNYFDDQYEENDEFITSHKISVEFHNNLIYNDQDWYKLNLTAYQVLNVVILFPDDSIPLIITLFDENQNELASSYNWGYYYDEIQHTISESGTYYIGIEGYGIVKQLYALNISTSDQDDQYEENDDWTSATPYRPENLQLLIGRDDDWFKFYGRFNGTMSLQVEFEYNVSGKVNARLQNSSGHHIMATSIIGSNYTLDFVVNGSQYFYFGLLFEDITVSYEFVINVWNADDQFEENDAKQSATQINPGLYPNLSGLDDDWFNLSVPAYTLVNIVIIFQNDDGDLDLFAESNLGGHFSTSITDNETIVLYFNENATVLIQVEDFNINLCYSLLITFEEDDVYENNDHMYEATPISVSSEAIRKTIAEIEMRVLIAKDEDWYTFQGLSGYLTQITLDLSLNTRYEEYQMNIYDSKGNLLSDPINRTDNSELKVSFHQDEVIFIQIKGISNSIQYSLGFEFGKIEDNYEENDGFLAAFPVESSFYPNLTSLDEDWFQIWIPSNYSLKVETTSYYDVDIYLYSDDYVSLDYSAGFSGNETVVWNMTTAGLIIFNIRGFGNVLGFPYSLNISLTELENVSDSPVDPGDNPPTNGDNESKMTTSSTDTEEDDSTVATTEDIPLNNGISSFPIIFILIIFLGLSSGLFLLQKRKITL